MITIPADNMNASLIEFIEQCLARIEAEVEIRLCAARKLRAEAKNKRHDLWVSIGRALPNKEACVSETEIAIKETR